MPPRAPKWGETPVGIRTPAWPGQIETGRVLGRDPGMARTMARFLPSRVAGLPWLSLAQGREKDEPNGPGGRIQVCQVTGVEWPGPLRPHRPANPLGHWHQGESFGVLKYSNDSNLGQKNGEDSTLAESTRGAQMGSLAGQRCRGSVTDRCTFFIGGTPRYFGGQVQETKKFTQGAQERARTRGEKSTKRKDKELRDIHPQRGVGKIHSKRDFMSTRHREKKREQITRGRKRANRQGGTSRKNQSFLGNKIKKTGKRRAADNRGHKKT